MTMTNHTSPTLAAELSDQDLLDATARAAADERRATTELIALLAEVDLRKLYLGEGYSSLFTYCRYRLHLSEFAAYSRITAARVTHRFPIVLDRLADGAVTLTSVVLLAAHLTDENHEALLDAVQHASRREVERLVANLYGQPDIPPSVRRLPEPEKPDSHAPMAGAPAVSIAATAGQPPMSSGLQTTRELFVADRPQAQSEPKAPAFMPSTPSIPPTRSTPPTRRDVVASLAVGRYLLRVTIGAETHTRLDRARDLLRHVIPNGDLALILDRALAVLIDQLERRKTGRISHPERTRVRGRQPRGRHIPAAVKREVWARDDGRCTFVGPHGRCVETGLLEYHHVKPYARGGPTDVANLELRCRAHNAYEAEREFGAAAHAASRST